MDTAEWVHIGRGEDLGEAGYPTWAFEIAGTAIICASGCVFHHQGECAKRTEHYMPKILERANGTHRYQRCSLYYSKIRQLEEKVKQLFKEIEDV